MASRYAGFGSRHAGDPESSENFVTIGTHFDPAEPTNSTSILASLGRKASKLVDLSSSNYGYDGKRFHGAFTGGFNAGFYNTVGSVEGWRPSEFKSSRTERAEKRTYEPEDYMDKGDFSEHGINPKQIRIRSTFDQTESFAKGAGKQPSGSTMERTKDDILRDMIRVKSLSIGKRILMSMGWKPGEGVGAKMSRKHRRKLKWSLTQETPTTQPASPPRSPPSASASSSESQPVKVYGVALPPPSFQQNLTKTSRLDDDDDDEYFDEQLYANVDLPPLDYEVHFQLQKQEHHGIGYKPLESLNLFGHENLFVQPSVSKQINNVKIRGQAFGVGIEEDEDDRDLFAEDDLKQYDYELTSANDTPNDIMRRKTQENNFQLKFTRYDAISMPVVYPPPTVPSDFRLGHRFPKSQMPPVAPPPVQTNVESVKTPSTQLDANARGVLLGDFSFLSRPPPNVPVATVKEETPPVKTTSAPAPAPSLEWDLEKERSAHTTPTPPLNNARTQFLDAVKNRFTSSSDAQQLSEQQSLQAALQSDLQKAVSMKLYGTLTRSTGEWRPSPLLCKRMNIPNPYPDDTYEDSKESKKSRRQLCSNLFDHLFTPASVESLAPQPESTSVETINPIPTSAPIIPPPPPPPPPAPKNEFASIDSFDQEIRERPSMDLFSAIFDNQDSDDEDLIEPEKEQQQPKDTVVKPTSTPITTTALPLSRSRPDSDQSESSDSSIEEIEMSPKDKLSGMYGPTIPSTLPTRPISDTEPSIWTKLANTSAQFVELKQKKKHKKKKKHTKKSKKHHH